MKLEKMAIELAKAQAAGKNYLLLHSHGRARDLRRTKCSWPMTILNVDLEDRSVYASWNHNPPQWWDEQHASKWRTLSYWDAEKKKAEKKAAPK